MGQPTCRTAQWVPEATLCCTCRINHQVEGPLICMHQCPPVCSGCSSRRGGWGCIPVPCRSARETRFSLRPLFVCMGNGAHWFSQSCIIASAPGEFSQFPDLLRAVFLAYCAETVPLAHSCLSGGMSLNIGVHLICPGQGGISASTYAGPSRICLLGHTNFIG